MTRQSRNDPNSYTSPNFVVPRKFLIKTYNKNINFAAPYNLATGYKVNLCMMRNVFICPRVEIQLDINRVAFVTSIVRVSLTRFLYF